MDATRFDALIRHFGSSASRRQVIAGLTGLAGALIQSLAPGQAADQPRTPCRQLGQICRSHPSLRCCPGTVCRAGRCACPPNQRRCQGTCIGRNQCCGTDCPGGPVCRGGRCQCPGGKKRCQGRCIRKQACCRTRDCGAAEVCRSGRCRCRPGFKLCQGGCIPDEVCCGGCPAEAVCRSGRCCAIGTTAALQAALAPGGPATIELCPDTTYQGTFIISRDVTIVGAGAASSILDGGGSGPVVTVANGVTAELQALRITGGAAVSGGGASIGTNATLTLREAEVTGNTATISGGGFNVSNGTLVLAGASRVVDNQSGGVGGGIRAFNSTITLLDTSAITGNQADPNNPNSGGGIFADGGTVSIGPQAVVSGNTPDNCEPTVDTCT
jgi:hypothetical protein